MGKHKHQQKNELFLYRRRRHLSQKQVANLLGQRNTSMLSRYETGRSVPPLEVALKLEIIYRVPVAFLYYDLYGRLREEIRRKETR